VAEELVAKGRVLEAIAALTRANRAQPDAATELRLGALRHAAFEVIDRSSGFSAWPPEGTRAPQTNPIPELRREELTAECLRANILGHGCVLVRQLIPDEQVGLLVDGIDRAFEVWAGLPRPFAKPTGSPWFDPLPLDGAAKESMRRTWVTNGAGILTADSPRMLFRLFEAFETIGLHQIVSAYLGERPALSANKCTLRRVPVDTNSGWHQDGAFLGRDIRALNIWVSLSHCGIDAPGLDILPQRFDHIVDTGTHGSYFDWAVGPERVQELAVDSAVTRPVFGPGDVLFFDDMLLHQTAADTNMTRPRYAIETWCFAPSHYPDDHVPLVW
jgi:hypothetical protein